MVVVAAPFFRNSQFAIRISFVIIGFVLFQMSFAGGVAHAQDSGVILVEATCAAPAVPGGGTFACTVAVENTTFNDRGAGGCNTPAASNGCARTPMLDPRLVGQWNNLADFTLVSMSDNAGGAWHCGMDLVCVRSGQLNSTANSGTQVAGNAPLGQIETLTLNFRIPADAHLTATAAPQLRFQFYSNHDDPNAVYPLPPDNGSVSGPFVDTVSLALAPASNLRLAKTLLNNHVAPGGTALFAITILNDGPSTIAGLGLIDTPADALTGQTATLTPGATSIYVPANDAARLVAGVPVPASAATGAWLPAIPSR
jgi:hypothetical protein